VIHKFWLRHGWLTVGIGEYGLTSIMVGCPGRLSDGVALTNQHATDMLEPTITRSDRSDGEPELRERVEGIGVVSEVVLYREHRDR
jgi:hypothetical protein